SGPSGPTRFMSRVQAPLSFRNRSPVLVFRYTSPGCPSLDVGSVAPLKNRMLRSGGRQGPVPHRTRSVRLVGRALPPYRRPGALASAAPSVFRPRYASCFPAPGDVERSAAIEPLDGAVEAARAPAAGTGRPQGRRQAADAAAQCLAVVPRDPRAEFSARPPVLPRPGRRVDG